jgi:6-pyruvoyl-tetrahydropterin synthase
MEIVKRHYHFHSAHRNTELENDKCWSIHGHTYHADILISNDKLPGKSTGLLFSEIDAKISPLIALLDHSFIIYKKDPLYEMLLPLGMRLYPTNFETSAENLAKYIFDILSSELPILEIHLKETTSSTVIYKTHAVMG